jgi:hypothetical protein
LVFLVFEFVGKIITNSKIAHRNQVYVKCNKYSYNIFLDADENMENLLNDEEALCLVEQDMAMSSNF